MNDIPTTIKKVKKMNHYPAHRKNRNSSTRRCWKKPERYYARLDLKYGIAFALSIIALLINVINLLRL